MGRVLSPPPAPGRRGHESIGSRRPATHGHRRASGVGRASRGCRGRTRRDRRPFGATHGYAWGKLKLPRVPPLASDADWSRSRCLAPGHRGRRRGTAGEGWTDRNTVAVTGPALSPPQGFPPATVVVRPPRGRGRQSFRRSAPRHPEATGGRQLTTETQRHGEARQCQKNPSAGPNEAARIEPSNHASSVPPRSICFSWFVFSVPPRLRGDSSSARYPRR